MPDAPNPTPDPTGMPAPTKVVAPKPFFTPTAAFITSRPRDKFLETIKNYKFAGNPKPDLVEEAKRIALSLAEIAPCDVADQLECRIEISGASAHQVLVQVTPHNY